MTKVTTSGIKYSVSVLQREFPGMNTHQAVDLAIKIKQAEFLEEISETLKTIAKNQKQGL